jgi:hypothetical protein
MFFVSIIMILLGIGLIAMDGIILTILGIILGGIGAIWLIRLILGR